MHGEVPPGCPSHRHQPPEANDPVQQHRGDGRVHAGPIGHEGEGEAPFDDAEASREDGEAGGRADATVGNEQAEPGHADPESPEADHQAGAVGQPVGDGQAEGHRPAGRRRPDRSDPATQLPRRSTNHVSKGYPCGQRSERLNEVGPSAGSHG